MTAADRTSYRFDKDGPAAAQIDAPNALCGALEKGYTEAKEGRAVSITVEIKPEVEAKLATQAADRGMDLRAYAAALLEQAAQPVEQQQWKKTISEFFMESPLAGSGIDLERDKDTGRDIEL